MMPQDTAATLLIVVMSCMVFSFSTAAVSSRDLYCPQNCTCQQNTVCTIARDSHWLVACKQLLDYAQTTELDLKFLGPLTDISQRLECLPKLQSLDLSATFLVVEEHMFRGLRVEKSLNLSSNGITFLPVGVFSALELLYELDISHNSISDLEPGIFQGLSSLKRLHIGFNMLSSLSAESFKKIPFLEYLDLEFNNVKEFSFSYIPYPAVLRTLNLRGNSLQNFITDTNSGKQWQNIRSLDISENPLECSCSLRNLLSILPNLNTVLVNASGTSCASPDSLRGRTILNVNRTELSCTMPNNIVSFPSNIRDVLSTSTISLQCHAKGYPRPSIMWVTPWGDRFYSGSPLLLHNIERETQADEMHTFRKYKEPNVFIVSKVHVTSHSELVIENIRGSMSGNYTCVAFNAAGNTTVEITLVVFSKVKSTYINSMLFGGYCATGFLIFGFMVGFIKMVVVWLRQKLYFIVPMFSKSPSARNPESAGSVCHSVDVSVHRPDSTDGDSDNATTGSALLADTEESDTFDLPDINNDGQTSGSWLPHGIFDTLEEAKGRLRYGVERKMERVRKNVQSLKESSSVYVHNIVETGSSAASKMKAGMVFSVEAVKYHMQSFKELCGTGDMGGQTISMVSVETDVDSNVRKEVVRQVTFV